MIPLESEALIPGKLRKRGSTFCEGLIEPVNQLNKTYPELLMGRTVVNCSFNNSIPIRMINTSTEPVMIKQGSNIGLLCPIEGNINSIETDSIETLDESTDDLLKDLINRTLKDVPDDQKASVQKFLTKNSDVFLKTDGKLGRCDLYQHTIETGDALPIKQEHIGY